MSKKAKLPGMPEQGIPLKTIHKGLKHKPKSTIKAVKQPKPAIVMMDIESTATHWAQKYFGQGYYKTGFESASAVISPPKIEADPDQYERRRGGVKTNSFEKGMEHLYQFPVTAPNSGFNYALLMEEEDGSYNMVDRVGMPCWGALREYRCGTRPDDDWPGDLQDDTDIFPKNGNPVAVAIQFHPTGMTAEQNKKYYSTSEQWNRFQAEFVFNTAISPWRKALKDFELVIKDDEFIGAVIKDTNIDPNIMVNIFRVCGFRESSFAKMWCTTMDNNPGMDGRVAFILSCKPDSYYQSAVINLDRWFSGEPYDLSSGLTFYQRESYNRPQIEYMFGGGNDGIATNSISQAKLEEHFADWLAKQQDGISRVA